MKDFITFKDPEKATCELNQIRKILNDDHSEIGALLSNLIDYSIEESKDLVEQAKEDCKFYFTEAPRDIGPTGYTAYLDCPIFAAWFFRDKGDEFMESVWPKIEKEAKEELINEY
jgi:hypothetical protein